jgi:hypothetical protein
MRETYVRSLGDMPQDSLEFSDNAFGGRQTKAYHFFAKSMIRRLQR